MSHILERRIFAGENVVLVLKTKIVSRHVYVIGKTGMGKSTVLENMAAQDIQNGEGMCLSILTVLQSIRF